MDLKKEQYTSWQPIISLGFLRESDSFDRSGNHETVEVPGIFTLCTYFTHKCIYTDTSSGVSICSMDIEPAFEPIRKQWHRAGRLATQNKQSVALLKSACGCSKRLRRVFYPSMEGFTGRISRTKLWSLKKLSFQGERFFTPASPFVPLLVVNREREIEYPMAQCFLKIRWGRLVERLLDVEGNEVGSWMGNVLSWQRKSFCKSSGKHQGFPTSLWFIYVLSTCSLTWIDLVNRSRAWGSVCWSAVIRLLVKTPIARWTPTWIWFWPPQVLHETAKKIVEGPGGSQEDTSPNPTSQASQLARPAWPISHVLAREAKKAKTGQAGRIRRMAGYVYVLGESRSHYPPAGASWKTPTCYKHEKPSG